MSYRTVIITNKAKLSFKNNYMIVRNEEVTMIHLSEINIIVIDTTQVSITTYLISELSKRKIKVIFCNEERNPICELVPLYGSHNTSKKILKQIKWNNKTKYIIWKIIIQNKILKQYNVLDKFEIDNREQLVKFSKEVNLNDTTNREGHAAKVYFNLLFGKEFSRSEENNINSALNYGYSIILSTINKEVVSRGYITQLGINHRNEFNFYNLSCDLMESFRPLVDIVVYNNKDKIFDKEFKYQLVNILNSKVIIENKEHYVSNAISIYVKNILQALDEDDETLITNYEL